ncbi:MAG: T9SS type A sorting domain-containing protein, partial [Rhodothermales bacterium]
SVVVLMALLIGAGTPSYGQESPTWVHTGGPPGGLGYDVRMRPDNPAVMYVTDAFAGTFRSTDGGQTWVPANQGVTARTGFSDDAIPIFCLTIDPHNHDIIWVGTQGMRGIFKSTNGGDSWTRMDNGIVEIEGITFRGFTVDPRTSDIVYAAGEISSFAWAGEPRIGREFDMTKGVVYKTIDGGLNWQAVWRGDNLARYIWIDPRNPDILYVSTGIFDREAANSDPVAGTPGGVGILKSTDAGQNWTQVNNGLNNLYVGTLFMHPENPDILLAGTGNNQYDDGSGVYLSTDGAASWQRTLTQGANSVEFSLSHPNIAYAGNPGAIYRSEDGGQTWHLMSGGGIDGWGSPGVRAGFPIDFQIDPRDPNRIFVNNYGGGNFLSVDGGETWTTASEGYTGAQVRDVAVGAMNPGRVFAAARSGLFLSPDGGDDWLGRSHPPAASLEWYAAAIDPMIEDHILAANNWDGVILESHDDGNTWRAASTRPADNMSFRAIVFAPSNQMIVYAGTSAFRSAGTLANTLSAAGIYISRDRGATWATANDATSQDANVTALAVDPSDPQVVYAATGNHGVLKSSDGGQNWDERNTGLPGTPPTALAVAIHPTDPNVVYVGLESNGIYHSTNGGATWQQLAAGLPPESSISDIVLSPADPQLVFIADKASGVYHSVNPPDGSWVLNSQGLRTRHVNALAFSADGQHLYAATEGEGVFRLDLSGQPPGGPTSVEPGDTPITAFRLEQNYPNPFNPETIIRYTLRQSAYVKLRVLNLLGMEVVTLINKEQKPGSYTVQWQGTDRHGLQVASGVYLYQLEAEGFVTTKKMVFIK